MSRKREGRSGKITVSKHSTPDFVFEQSYYQQIKDRVNLRTERPKGWSWSYLKSNCDPSRAPRGVQTLKVTFQGKFVQAKVITKGKQPPTRSKRSFVTNFSAGSRGRLFDLFNKIDLRRKMIFITLTVRTEGMNTHAGKLHLRAFIKRLLRYKNAENASFIWRLEFQERGAIHFHICAFGLPFIPKETIQSYWGEITGESCPFTRIEQVYSHKKAMNYVGKYVAKVNPTGQNGGFNLPTYQAAYEKYHGTRIGRVWGIENKKCIPFAPETTLELAFNYAKFMRFRELAAKQYPPISNSLSLGFRLYVPSAEAWLGWFHGIYDIDFNKKIYSAYLS